MIEVLTRGPTRGQLVWTPELAQEDPDTKLASLAVGTGAASTSSGHHVFRLSDYEDDADFRGGRYSVTHYPPDAVGKAFGPIALDQMLRFCLLLENKLREHSSVAIAPRNDAECANAGVLLGAFLILRREWTAEKVALVLSTVAKIGFYCSWTGIDVAPRKRHVMSVKDCWAGVSLARKMNWIDPIHLESEFGTKLICSQHRRTITCFDAVWLVPSEIMVSADPMTVVMDPNPVTCSEFKPSTKPRRLTSNGTTEQAITNTETEEPETMNEYERPLECQYDKPLGVKISDKPLGGDPEDKESTASLSIVGQGSQSCPSECSTKRDYRADVCRAHEDQEGIAHDALAAPSSCDTVCKDYVFTGLETHGDPQSQSFMDWYNEQGISIMVRLNDGTENGLAEIGGSYNKSIVMSQGMKHFDLPVSDQGGGVPNPSAVAEMIKNCALENTMSPPIILVHCKGGFGRSVVLACCVLIHRYNIPGRSLLGWVRIVRPGAITTPAQERFLCCLGGQADLDKYMKHKLAGCCVIS